MSTERLDIPLVIPAATPTCESCPERLRDAVTAIHGVASAEIDPTTSFLHVSYDATAVSKEQLVAETDRLGFEIGSAIGHASWRIGGLDCPDCAKTVDISVGYLDGVVSASLNFASGVLTVEYETSTDPRVAIADLIRRMGYTVEPTGDTSGRPVAEFRLVGLDCPDCAAKLEARVHGTAGVSRAEVEFNTAKMRVAYDPSTTDPESIAAQIERAGYAVELIGAGVPGLKGPSWWSTHRAEVLTAISGLLIVAGWGLARLSSAGEETGRVVEYASIAAYLLAIALGGMTVFRRAISSIRARSLDMNVLMTIAVIGSIFIGEWAEGASVVFLFAIGGVLESRSLARTRSSIRDLMDLSPKAAHVRRGNEMYDLALSEVIIGDRVIVRPGERIPLDGTVADGTSAIDESPITGESVPVDKAPGADVFAGTLNTTGLIEVDVTARAGDSTLARIIYLVEEAQAQQAPFQRLVDRFTRWYTPTVVILAIFIAIVPPALGAVLGAPWGDFETWFYRALVLLVVSCPCALVISTPVAIVSAITRATRDGVLIKGGAFLELAPRVRAVAFDKTGTLTLGRPRVSNVVALDSVAAEEVLTLAARLDAHSTHPLARAVVRAAEAKRLLAEGDGDGQVTGLSELPGRGVIASLDGVEYALGSTTLADERRVLDAQALAAVDQLEERGQTVLVLARLGDDGRALGVIGIADEVRETAATTVGALRAAGVEHFVMLTGDNERTAGAVAAEAGVTDVRARLLPQDKTNVLAELRERYGTVAMVGDGVNDAPALALADIGIAMGAAGSDTALETADVALMSDDLAALPRFIRLGHRTVGVIRQNVWFSVAVKVAVLVAAIAGYAPLWLAVFADTGVALLVILNGLRLLRPA